MECEASQRASTSLFFKGNSYIKVDSPVLAGLGAFPVPVRLVEGDMVAEEVDAGLEVGDFLAAIDYRWAIEPAGFLALLGDPGVGGLQGALTYRHVEDVIVMRHDHPWLQPLDDRFGVRKTHDVLGIVDRQQQDVDLSERVPDLVWWIVSVVAPGEDPQPAGLNQDQAVVPGAWIVRWLYINAVEMADDPLEVVHGGRGVGCVLIGNAGQRYVAKPVGADQSIQQHVRVKAVQRIVVKMRVGGDPDIDGSDWKVVKIPIPFSGWKIAPRVDHNSNSAGRRDAKRRAPKIS